MKRPAEWIVFLAVLTAGQGSFLLCPAACCTNPDKAEPNAVCSQAAMTVEQILDQMHKSAQTLTSLQADLEYLFIQDPELLEARTTRLGILYYCKGTDKSNLRISFRTVQQDQEEPQIRPEHYLFDGVWLTKIDHAMETVDLYQKAPADKPAGVFDFISHNFPMVGFTDPKKLEKEFVISVSRVPAEPNQPQHLMLEVRPDSIYKDDYTKIEVWVNRTIWLPIRLTAVSVQGDFYDLKWHHLRTNEPIPQEIFNIEIPAQFRKNTHPLEQ
jgi:hypothetical protein